MLPLLPATVVEQSPAANQPRATTTTTSTTTSVPIEVLVAGVDFAGLEQWRIDLARAEHGRCGEWYELALEADWSPEDWPQLSRIMWRESRCTPTAWNGRVPAADWQPGSGCPDAGLVQINCVHRQSFTELGWQWPQDAFDPLLNLHFAAMLYDHGRGCKHWAWLDC